MAKVQVTLDADALRACIFEQEYKNKDGEQVKKKKVKFELVEVKDPQIVYEADSYMLLKTHFAVKSQTKEEREKKADPVYLGEGIQTLWKKSKEDAKKPASNNNSASTDGDDDLPF